MDKNIRFLVVLFLFHILYGAQATIESNYDICMLSTCSKEINSKDVIDFCKTKSGVFYGRCCLVNKTDQVEINDFILAIDFTNCSLENDLDLLLKRNDPIVYNHVGVMDLRNNTNLKSFSDEAFYGFVKLDKLFVPNDVPCPGQNFSWSHIDNNTCSGLQSICNTTYPNVKCTDSSVCSDYGPANFNCVCKKNYHGYKCLEEGEFPLTAFVIAICVSTVVLSILLWYTQRRHVKKD